MSDTDAEGKRGEAPAIEEAALGGGSGDLGGGGDAGGDLGGLDDDTDPRTGRP